MKVLKRNRWRLALIILINSLLWLNRQLAIVPADSQTVPVPGTYFLNYDLDENGHARVSSTVRLFNPNQNVYISDYSLLLNYTDIQNLTASDPAGSLKSTLTKEENGTLLSFKINKKVVGVDKPLELTLRYETDQTAKKSGLVWEITLPKAADIQNIIDYQLSVTVPNSFGPKIFTSPDPQTIEKKLAKTTYLFSGKDLAKTGSILSFGPYQIYDFHLKYHLKNVNLWRGQAKITLPPSIFGQQLVLIDQITPPPENVTADDDGNYLASYTLNPAQVETVEVKGRAKIYNLTTDVSRSGTFAEIPQSLEKNYLSPQKYWEVDRSEIKKLVEQTVGEITSTTKVSDVAKKLFDQTVLILKYNPERIQPNLTRLGAIQALNHPDQAVCMEFADVYITLLRQAGIPAQLLEGYAYTQDLSSRPAIGDVLHSWVRLYLPRVGWIETDPTWANTTNGLDYFSHLDTNHFVFVIKGLNSEAPFPAGAYKISPDQVGDIEVKVLGANQDFGDPENVLNTRLDRIGFNPFWTKSKNYSLVFKNSGKGPLFSLKYDSPTGQSQNLGNLPPLGYLELPYAGVAVTEKQKLGKISYLNNQGTVESKEIIYRQKQNFDQNSNGRPNLGIILLFLILVPCSFLGFWLTRRVMTRR